MLKLKNSFKGKVGAHVVSEAIVRVVLTGFLVRVILNSYLKSLDKRKEKL